jgi:excinuclease ABC subunit A
MYVPCDVCKGKRYNRETLEIRYRGRNISQVLDLTVEQALEYFDAVPSVARKLNTLMDVGLSYLRLGQSATTLSGGEAQRVKLSQELSKRSTGRTLYILDEPTTGLHFQDIALLLDVLRKLVEGGNTVVIIEHNLDVIKTADWVIDLGPEGGDGGGRIIAQGTPEQVAATIHGCDVPAPNTPALACGKRHALRNASRRPCGKAGHARVWRTGLSCRRCNPQWPALAPPRRHACARPPAVGVP